MHATQTACCCVQAVQRPLDRSPSFQHEELAQEALLCQKLKAHSSAVTACLILTDTGAEPSPPAVMLNTPFFMAGSPCQGWCLLSS